MGHTEHKNAAGLSIPSVSEVPGIYATDLSGFEDWICRQEHGVDDRCCTQAKRKFYAESADLGTDIHALREAFLRGEPFVDAVPEYQAAVFEPVARFYKESGYKPLYIEQQMTGKKFGGTLDGAGTFEVPFWEAQRVTFWDKRTREALANGTIKPPTTEDLFIEDLKIKSKLDVLHPIQLIGYADLMLETKQLIANWGLIVRREKNLTKRPEIQLRGYYLPLYRPEWQASFLMWGFLNG